MREDLKTCNTLSDSGASVPDLPGKGRSYPRGPHEVGGVVGERRAQVGLAVVPHLYPSMAELESAALTDLGGEESVSALHAETVRLAVWADSMVLLLMDEIRNKAEVSRCEGRTPHVSRYKATACVGSFMALAGRLFTQAGLERRARRVDSYVAERLERQRDGNGGLAGRQAGDGDGGKAGGLAPGPALSSPGVPQHQDVRSGSSEGKCGVGPRGTEPDV